MHVPRSLVASLTLLLAALALTACGGGGEDAGSDARTTTTGDDRMEAPATATPATTPEPGTPGAADERTSAAGYVVTPEVATCMKAAGFADDGPPTGGLKAWRHPDGGRAVIAADGDVTLGIASEIGTAENPANVDGNRVIAGPPATAAAAAKCLADAHQGVSSAAGQG